MTRKKHVKSEYDKARTSYRNLAPRHVVTFETDMTEQQKRDTFACSDRLRVLGNAVVAEMNRRIEQLARTKKYRRLRESYKWCSSKMDQLNPESDDYKKHESDRGKVGKQMQGMQKAFGVTKNLTAGVGSKLHGQYNLGSMFVLSRCDDIWSGCEKVLYGSGERLRFKKRFDLPAIRAKQPNRGIVIRLDRDSGGLAFTMEGIGTFGVQIPKNDILLQEECAAIVDFLRNETAEEEAVNHFLETGELIPVFRPCYAALVCKVIRGKLRVYVQVTVTAKALPKKKKDGSPRHAYGKGRVGCDIGTQSFAAVTDQQVFLENLAERDHLSTKRTQHKERMLQQKIDRSIRAMNPDRFNEDGTAKKIKGPYKKSKRCRKLLYRLREQKRRDRETRHYAVLADANRLRSEGDVLITERQNTKALQRRSKKPSEKSDKTIQVMNKDGNTRTVQKNKRKKRFGKSIQYRCPGAFQTALKQKFGAGYHEVPMMYRASQYDHVLDDYIKKKLSERWHHLPNGTKIQRDIYSAFLMYCANEDFTAPDRSQCIKVFDRFFKMHELTIQNIIHNHYTVCNSGIAA